MFIVQKIMLFILVFCILYVLKKLADFFIAFLANRKFETDGGKVMLYLGLALSYIITIIFTGFKLI